MDKNKIAVPVLAVGLALSLAGNVFQWTGANQKAAEYTAAMANLETEMTQLRETLQAELDQSRAELEQTKSDLDAAQRDLELSKIPLETPFWVIDPNTGLPILASESGKPAAPGTDAGAQAESDKPLNGEGGTTGGSGGTLDGLLKIPEGLTAGGKTDGTIGDTSNTPHYNPFA